MVKILYEHAADWPESGPLRMDAHVDITGVIEVSPDSARQRANGYLGKQVGMAIQSSDPVLVWQKRPVWRLQVNLYLRGVGKVATLSTLDIDAITREVLPLADKEITDIQARANAIALRLSPSTTTAV